jgi:hypothetical protein
MSSADSHAEQNRPKQWVGSFDPAQIGGRHAEHQPFLWDCRQHVQLHRDELLADWELAQARKELAKIDPLP